jgi:hypothetical protein
MPHEAKTAVVTYERDVAMPFSNEKKTRRERTVAWNATKTHDEGYFEAAFADDPCKAAISDICLFKHFLHARDNSTRRHFM